MVRTGLSDCDVGQGFLRGLLVEINFRGCRVLKILRSCCVEMILRGCLLRRTLQTCSIQKDLSVGLPYWEDSEVM